jgi:hypothetical protein
VGILDVDERLWPIITWRHDLENRWKLILQYAPKKHDKDACDSLRKIKKQLTIKVIRDRNIIVHGLVHAMAEIRNPQPEADNTIDAPVFVMPPCWSEAGKNCPISRNRC